MSDEICDQFLYDGREHVSLLDYASIRDRSSSSTAGARPTP